MSWRRSRPRRKALIALVLLTAFAGCGPAGTSVPANRHSSAPPRITKEWIRDTPEARLTNLLFEYCLARLDEGTDERETFAALPRGLQALFTSLVLEGEVNNGGFNQYFWNSSGELAPEALAGLERVGATEHAALLRRAMAIELQERATHEKFRQQNTLEAFSESYKHTALNDLDDEYYKLEEDLDAILVRYVRAHPTEFVHGRE